MTDDVPLTVATYLRLRGLKPNKTYRRRIRLTDDDNQPFTKGRDPKPLGLALDAFAKQAGWEQTLSREDLALKWAEIVGEASALQSTPVGISGSTLIVKCKSNAWMKELNNLRGHIVTKIINDHPDAEINDVRFLGPDAPSWKWGPRSVPGRGPRDTYG